MFSQFGYANILNLVVEFLSEKDITDEERKELLLMKSKCHINLKDYMESYSTYKEIIEVDPLCVRALDGLAYLYLKEEKYDQSLVFFQKSISINAKSETSLLGLGLVFYGLKKYEESVKWLSLSLEFNSLNTVALFTLVNISYISNEYEYTIEAIEKYLQDRDDNMDMRYTLAGLYYKQKIYKKAKLHVDYLIKKNPDDKKYKSLLTRILQNIDKHELNVG
tara:strand:- start:312 stop:974 length:663 start_codon:yes stop_codon:yes gene_type:complete